MAERAAEPENEIPLQSNFESDLAILWAKNMPLVA